MGGVWSWAVVESVSCAPSPGCRNQGPPGEGAQQPELKAYKREAGEGGELGQ